MRSMQIYTYKIYAMKLFNAFTDRFLHVI
jgi:hypothetical protein